MTNEAWRRSLRLWLSGHSIDIMQGRGHRTALLQTSVFLLLFGTLNAVSVVLVLATSRRAVCPLMVLVVLSIFPTQYSTWLPFLACLLLTNLMVLFCLMPRRLVLALLAP